MVKHVTNASNYVYRRHRRTSGSTKWQILKNSFIATCKEYCSESSICGLKHLVDKNTPYIERIIWTITLIGALIGSIILVWMTFHKYYFAPLVTTQLPEGVSVDKIIFPAVGICSNNRISRRAVTELAKALLQAERNKKYNETEMLSLLFGLGQLYDFQMVHNNYSAIQVHEALGNYDVNDLLRNLTPRCEDLLVRCVWNEIIKNCSELFDFRLTMNGYCCAFNYLRSSDELLIEQDKSVDKYEYGNKSSFDVDQGLQVLLRLNNSDDFYYNMPLEGAQLQFSDAYDFPDSPSGSFAMQMISPSVQMTVLVMASLTESSRDIQKVPVELRQCLFYDESAYLPFYTLSDCLMKCRVLFLLQNCNCTPFNMPKMTYTRTCDLRDTSCLRKYFVQSITIRPRNMISPDLELDLVAGGIECPMCYPTCSKTAYKYQFFNVNIYPNILNAVPDSDRDHWLQGANYSGSSIVHVKYGNKAADCYGQNVIMQWFDLISNIGSTWGFVTGFSFVSVLEFIYFFIVKLVRNLEHKRRRHSIVKSLVQSTPGQLESKGYGEIYWNELIANRQNFGNRIISYSQKEIMS